MMLRTCVALMMALALTACGEPEETDTKLVREAKEWTEQTKELSKEAWEVTKDVGRQAVDKSKELYEDARATLSDEPAPETVRTEPLMDEPERPATTQPLVDEPETITPDMGTTEPLPDDSMPAPTE